MSYDMSHLKSKKFVQPKYKRVYIYSQCFNFCSDSLLQHVFCWCSFLGSWVLKWSRGEWLYSHYGFGVLMVTVLFPIGSSKLHAWLAWIFKMSLMSLSCTEDIMYHACLSLSHRHVRRLKKCWGARQQRLLQKTSLERMPWPRTRWHRSCTRFVTLFHRHLVSRLPGVSCWSFFSVSAAHND